LPTRHQLPADSIRTVLFLTAETTHRLRASAAIADQGISEHAEELLRSVLPVLPAKARPPVPA
jgi:hypothetical protein